MKTNLQKIGTILLIGSFGVFVVGLYLWVGKMSYGIMTDLDWVLRNEPSFLVIPLWFVGFTGGILFFIPRIFSFLQDVYRFITTTQEVNEK